MAIKSSCEVAANKGAAKSQIGVEEFMSNTNRWGLAVAGFLMQMALGAVYAWSV